jgi:3',5'-cyclic AMP phosphodiesterase CpdA
LIDDLEGIAEHENLWPDLVIVTGNLTRSARPDEYDGAFAFLERLAESLHLPRTHLVVLPGLSDVNLLDSEAYFLTEQARGRAPVEPYWPKWQMYAEAINRFYEGIDGVTFMPSEPWTLFEIAQLRVVVAAFNSTMAASHVHIDRPGSVGNQQIKWFASQLKRYRQAGWLRIGAVSHNLLAEPD